MALNRDLSIDVRHGPYAVLLGLPQADGSPDIVRDRLNADLHFFTREHAVPDLGLQELWIHVRCDKRGTRRRSRPPFGLDTRAWSS